MLPSNSLLDYSLRDSVLSSLSITQPRHKHKLSACFADKSIYLIAVGTRPASKDDEAVT